ncbi:MAG: flagellar basal body-associated FliL family protein [Thermodesulfobacteriota bacterium]
MAEETQEGGGKLKKLILAVVVVVVVLGGAAAALYFLAPGLVPGLGQKQESEAPGEAPAAVAPGEPEPMGIIYGLKPFIVNLRDPMGKRYLKVELSLELPSEEVKMELESRLPPIRNDILLLLSNLTYEDIADMEGKRRLRRQIKDRCDAYLKAGKVTAVFFSEFVVQ